jgi:hypothetical protein
VRHARLTVRKPSAIYTGTDPKHVAQRVKLTKMLSCESLLSPSRLSMHRSMKSLVRENPQGRSTKKVMLLLLNDNHLEAQDVRLPPHRGDDDLE